MDKFSKMRTLCIIYLTFLNILCEIIAAEHFHYSTNVSHSVSNSSDICRKKRDADDEDVINRFEMERVSPLFEIARHLPAFEDTWLSNPVTIPTFPSFPSIKLENESSSYDEYKIEIIKDEEHVIGESGKQFKENSALNWYYSAESYSSVNNFTNHNSNILKSELNTFPSIVKTTPTFATTLSTHKTSISRKQDDEHVVSHVPSLKDGRGTFLDFNLLESSTTPKFDSTMPLKSEEVKPNITTRYFLLKSGRIVAINVTSVSTIPKPTASSGQENKNPLLYSFYFGSRIRNKNSSNEPSTTNNGDSVRISLTKTELEKTTPDNQRTSIERHFAKSNQLKVNDSAKEDPKHHNRNTSSIQSGRKSPKYVDKSVTIKPNVEYFKTQKPSFTPSMERLIITPHVEYSKLKQSPFTNNSKQTNQFPITTKEQPLTENASKKFTPQVIRESTTLDPAQKWWSEMKAAKKERLSLLITTAKPKVTTKTSSNTAKVLTSDFAKSLTHPFNSKIFDSMKTASKESVTSSTIELTANARSAKLRMTEKQALHFSTTAAPPKILKTSTPLQKSRWSIFSPLTETISKTDETLTRNVDEDLLEPSVPRSELKHDFVRIVTLPPPFTLIHTSKTSAVTDKPVKEIQGHSRRPKYRGLSHVNLQAPNRQRLEFSTRPSKQDSSTFPSNYQLTTNSYKKPVNYQWWNTESSLLTTSPTIETLSTSLPRISRPAFYLRNSVSFQTIPPGSLTDRRTLTSENPNSDVGVIESLQPPLEDFLIIGFEPTRKSMEHTEAKHTDKSVSKQEVQKSLRGTAKTTKRPTTLIRSHEKLIISTIKPQRKHTQNRLPNIHPTEQVPFTPRTGNREGRHFRNSNLRSQNIGEKVLTTNPDVSTTKQPFRVYYFEPKRRRSKRPNENTKNETGKTVPLEANKPLRDNVQRTPVSNRGLEVGRNRGAQSYDRSINTRRAKQLQSTSREVNFATDAPTTSKASTQRLRSSPFIWHRPNVGTSKPVI